MAVIQSEATLSLRQEREIEEYKNSLISINQEVDRMSSMVHRLLFLARSENNNGWQFTKVNVSKIVETLVDDISWLCEDKDQICTFKTKGDTFISGDEVTLRELFFNLVDNAIRHTPKGGIITITIDEHKKQATIAVQDTGEGIPEDHLPHIFDRFYRVDKTRSRSEGGSGLGLAICKRIVEVHQGSISVESKVGEGTTFLVTLPLADIQK